MDLYRNEIIHVENEKTSASSLGRSRLLYLTRPGPPRVIPSPVRTDLRRGPKVQKTGLGEQISALSGIYARQEMGLADRTLDGSGLSSAAFEDLEFISAFRECRC